MFPPVLWSLIGRYKIFCLVSKACRRTVGTAFQLYVQETESGGYEFGINKLSPFSVCFLFLYHINCDLCIGEGLDCDLRRDVSRDIV